MPKDRGQYSENMNWQRRIKGSIPEFLKENLSIISNGTGKRKVEGQYIELTGDWKSYDGTLEFKTKLKNQ
jgi:hypothetical protein